MTRKVEEHTIGRSGCWQSALPTSLATTPIDILGNVLLQAMPQKCDKLLMCHGLGDQQTPRVEPKESITLLWLTCSKNCPNIKYSSLFILLNKLKFINVFLLIVSYTSVVHFDYCLPHFLASSHPYYPHLHKSLSQVHVRFVL